MRSYCSHQSHLHGTNYRLIRNSCQNESTFSKVTKAYSLEQVLHPDSFVWFNTINLPCSDQIVLVLLDTMGSPSLQGQQSHRTVSIK